MYFFGVCVCLRAEGCWVYLGVKDPAAGGMRSPRRFRGRGAMLSPSPNRGWGQLGGVPRMFRGCSAERGDFGRLLTPPLPGCDLIPRRGKQFPNKCASGGSGAGRGAL